MKNKIVPTIVYEEYSENDSVSTFHSSSDFDHINDFEMIEYEIGERDNDIEYNSRVPPVPLSSSSVSNCTAVTEKIVDNHILIKPQVKRKSSLRKGMITSTTGDSTPTKGRRLSFSDENGLDLYQTVYVENCHYPKKESIRLESDDNSLEREYDNVIVSIHSTKGKNSSLFVKLICSLKRLLSLFRK